MAYAGEISQLIAAVPSPVEREVYAGRAAERAGISREAMPKLFDGFFTHDDRGQEGGRRNMGIGLSVCMSIVQALGGTMRAENRKKGGALLQFSLPLEENSHEHQR